MRECQMARNGRDDQNIAAGAGPAEKIQPGAAARPRRAGESSIPTREGPDRRQSESGTIRAREGAVATGRLRDTVPILLMCSVRLRVLLWLVQHLGSSTKGLSPLMKKLGINWA